MAKNKVIYGTRRVVDCEHWGDVDGVVREVKKLGCDVTEKYWDGHDCGNAFVRFKFDSSKFGRIYDLMCGYDVTFSEDINDYVTFGENWGDGFERKNYREYVAVCDAMKNDFADGFWTRLPFELTFESGVCKHMTDVDVVRKCMDKLGISVNEVVCYTYEVVSGCKFCKVLFKLGYEYLSDENIRKIGQYVHYRGFLHMNGIYGGISCYHKLFNCLRSTNYDDYRDVCKKIANGEDLTYKSKVLYTNITKHCSPLDYLNADGSFNLMIHDGESNKDLYFCGD